MRGLVDFVESGTSWRKYKGIPEYPIDGRYLNHIHNKYFKLGIYDEINVQLIKKYLKTDRENKLKYQSTLSPKAQVDLPLCGQGQSILPIFKINKVPLIIIIY
jgi:hypothetical protein